MLYAEWVFNQPKVVTTFIGLCERVGEPVTGFFALSSFTSREEIERVVPKIKNEGGERRFIGLDQWLIYY